MMHNFNKKRINARTCAGKTQRIHIAICSHHLAGYPLFVKKNKAYKARWWCGSCLRIIPIGIHGIHLESQAYTCKGFQMEVTICQSNICLYIALHCITLHCIALHCIVLHCIVLHCIAFWCTYGKQSSSYSWSTHHTNTSN